MSEGPRFLLTVAAIAVIVSIFILSVSLPMAYFEGKAKASYLKKTQRIELEWYEACFIDVKSGSADARVSIWK